jgi:hypothetical protein
MIPDEQRQPEAAFPAFYNFRGILNQGRITVMSTAHSNQLQLNQDTGNTANKSEELFPKGLKIAELSKKAICWQEQFPIIRRIRLYRANPDEFFLLFELFEMPDKSSEEITTELRNLHDNFGDPLFDSGFKNDLSKVYHENDMLNWSTAIFEHGEPLFYPGVLNTPDGKEETNFHWLLTEREIPPQLFNIDTILTNAQLSGLISDVDLIQILAWNEDFTVRWLPILWNRFGCSGGEGKNVLNVSTLAGRLNGWLIFINRIAYGFLRAPGDKPAVVGGFRPKRIRKYSWDNEDEPVERHSSMYFMDRGYNGLLLDPTDIQDYFNRYGVSEMLFPSPGSTSEPSPSPATSNPLPGETEAAPGDIAAQDTQDQTLQDGNNPLPYINDPWYGEWLDMREHIQSKYSKAWGDFEHVCLNPFEPGIGKNGKPRNAGSWKHEMLCKIACLKIRLDDPSLNSKSRREEIYYRVVEMGYLENPQTGRREKTEHTEFKLPTFKEWTKDVYPKGVLEKGREKKLP